MSVRRLAVGDRSAMTEPSVVIRPSALDRLVAIALACLFEVGVVVALIRPGRSWGVIVLLLVGPVVVVGVLRVGVVASDDLLISRTLLQTWRWSADDLTAFRVKWRWGGGCVEIVTADGSTIELSATKSVGLRSGRRQVEGMRDELTAWLERPRVVSQSSSVAPKAASMRRYRWWAFAVALVGWAVALTSNFVAYEQTGGAGSHAQPWEALILSGVCVGGLGLLAFGWLSRLPRA